MPYEISSGILSYEEGDLYQAIGHLENAAVKYPLQIESHIYLASAYLGVEDYMAAISAANKGLEFFPEQIRLKLIRAEAYYRSGNDAAIEDYLDIITQFEQDEELERSSGFDVRQLKAAVGKLYQGEANKAYQDGRSEEAINLYYKAREFIPDSVTVHNNLAYILFENNRFDESLNVLIKATEKFPAAENLNVLKGQIYSEMQNTDKLLEVYAGLHRNHPDNLDYAVIYGQLLMSNNQAQKANLLFESLITENPKEVKLYDLLVRMNEQRFDYGGKRNVLKMQRAAFPEDRAVAMELAKTHVLIEEYDKARVIYDSLAVYDESEKFDVLSAKTWVFEEDFETAIQKYRSILTEFDENQDIYLEAAMLYQEINQPSTAVEMLQKADSIEPNDGIKLQISSLLIEQGYQEEALEYLNELLQSRYDSFALYHINKITDQEISRRELSKIYKEVLTEMISLYRDLYEKFTDRVSETSNELVTSDPQLIQQDPVLTVIENTLDNFFNHVSEKFQYDESLEIIDHALLTHSDSAKLHYHKGLLSYKTGKPDIALDAFRKAIEHGAKDYHLYFLMGNIYREQGEMTRAILSFEQTLTLNPEFHDGYSHLIAVSKTADKLNALCDRWLLKFKADKQNKILKEYLIEALHKANRFEEATQILRADDSR